MYDYISEAEALDDWADYGDELEDDWDDDYEVSKYSKPKTGLGEKQTELLKRKTIVEKAKVGDTVKCPVCNKKFVKSTYNKIFCSNGRTVKGRSSCKDVYHNTFPKRNGKINPYF